MRLPCRNVPKHYLAIVTSRRYQWAYRTEGQAAYDAFVAAQRLTQRLLRRNVPQNDRTVSAT